MTSAPATEVIITIQFEAPVRSLNALEIADLYAHLKSEFPVYDQVQPAGPMPYKLGHLDGTEPLNVSITDMPRLRFIRQDRTRQVLFQCDRMSYAWQRTMALDEEDNYPGFDDLHAEFLNEWRKMSTWLKQILDESPKPKVGEIAYVNAFHTRNADETMVRLSDIYCFLSPSPTKVLINGYSHSWNEKLRIADGILGVAAEGPVVLPSARPGTILALTATFLLADAEKMADEFLAVRKRIGETFKQVVNQEKRPK